MAFKSSEEVEAASSTGNPAISMADLDEALFPIPQLVNFSASLVTREDNVPDARDQLEIEVFVLPDAAGDVANLVRLDIDSIPALQIACQTKALDIWIQVQEFDPASAGSMAKRVIVRKSGC